jgi:type IV pilus assembly protein PilC
MTTGLAQKPKGASLARRSAPRGGAVRGRSANPAERQHEPRDGVALQVRLWRPRVHERDLAALCQHLAALGGSGVTLADCLRTFREEMRPGVLRDVLREVISDLEAGRKLSDALQRHPQHFSAYFRASIWAGEAGGTMTETLDRLARYLENKMETEQRIRAAFAYPVVLLTVNVAVVSFLLLYVIPIFAGVYEKMGVALPLVTQMLMGFSRTVVSCPYIPAGVLVLAAGWAIWMHQTAAGRLWFDRWKVQIPVVGYLFRQMALFRFLRCFGESLGAGVPVLEALELAGRVTGNRAFMADLGPVRQAVQRGMGLTEPLRRTGWFSPSLLQVISSGEQSGRVPALLARAADTLQRDVDLTTKRVVGRIEPVLTIGMALVVGTILLAVYLPMFDVMQHVGK